MGKAFNILVFDGWIVNSTEISTDPSLAATLGSADELRFQINVTEASGTTPSVVTNYYLSNDNVHFDTATPAIAFTTPALVAPAQYFWSSSANWVNGGFGRVGVKMGQSATKAYVRVYVAGRTR